MAESELFSFNTGGKKPSLRDVDKPSSGALASKAHTVSSDSDGASSSSSSGRGGYSSDENGTRRRRK